MDLGTFTTVYFWCALMIGAYGVTLPSPMTSPTMDQYVPADSDENVTYTCTAQGSGESVIWEVNSTTQIFLEGQFSHFESLGVFIHPRHTNSNISSITLSREARYVHGLNQVQCHSLQNFAVTGEAPIHYIIMYDPPTTPTDFTLQPSLMLVWTRPSNVPLQVPVDYTIEINATEEGGMNFINVTSNTSFSVQFLEDMLRDSERECVEFQFFVSAGNGAGISPLATIKDTVPISPDVRNVSRDLKVMSVDVQSQTAQILFPPVMPCNVNFSLTNYTINIDEDMNRTLTPGDVMPGKPVTIRNLILDASSSLTIKACNNVTCRTSDSRNLNTTDVQTVQAVFFQNNLYLQCSFATNSQAEGCMFSFTRSLMDASGTDQYNVSREEGFICTEAPYRLDAYGSIVVMDREESGVEGSVALNITNTSMVVNIMNPEEYTRLTNCPVDDVPPNVGAIAAGSSAGVVVFIAVVVIVAVLLIVFITKQRGFKKKRIGRSRIASDSGDAEDIPVLYECEINAGDFKDKIIESLGLAREEPPPTFRYNKESEQVIEMEPQVHEGMSSGPPPPPISGVVSNLGVIEMPEEAASSGPPPPPISGEISSTGVIEMPEESTVSRTPPRSGVVGDYDSPEASDDEETAASAPLLKSTQDEDKRVTREIEKRVKEELDKRVKQELDKRVKQELDERVKQELDERVKQELDERVKQELDERVKQEVHNELTKEINKRVRLEHGDSGTPLTLKVQWKSLIDSLLARGGNKDYNFSKLKVELEF